MNAKSPGVKEKEREEKLKILRQELEEKLEAELPPEMLDPKTRVEIQKIDEGEILDPARAKRVVEALLFASSKPLTVAEIKKVVGVPPRGHPNMGDGSQMHAGRAQRPSPTVKDIENWISELREEYNQQRRSFEILDVAGGYEIATRKEFAPWIFKIEMQKKARQATQSALETLAILAYKQPITRAEIEDLRGVDVSAVLATLTARSLIKIVGKKEVPGRPFLYGTTEKFLEHFGLKSLADLPNIEEIKSLVEKAVSKDQLLGTQKIVEVTDDKDNNGSQPPSQEN